MKKILFIGLLVFIYCPVFSQFVATLTGFPVNTTGWTYGGNSYVNGATFTLTDPTTTQTGYIYYSTPTNLTSCAQFDVDFDFQIIPSFGTVADGIAFWYITNPPNGFITGGGIGLPNDPNGLILIQDTYNNDNVANNPLETMIYDDGTFNYVEGSGTGQLGAVVPNQNFIDDGNWHHCKLTYNNGNINVYYNNNLTPSITAFYPITITGYFGFSASTGASYSTQNIKNVNIVASPLGAPPLVVSPVTYCQFAPATPLTATGTNLTWYATLNGTPLPGAPTPNTSIPGTTWYYVSQTVNVCPSASDSIEVIVYPQPAPPIITGDTIYCQNAVFNPFTVTGQNILWYTTATGGIGTATAPTVNTGIPGTYTYYASQTINGCEGLRDSITVNVIQGPSVTAMEFTNPTVCGVCDGTITLHGLTQGVTDTFTYTYNGVPVTNIMTVGNGGIAVLPGLCDGTYTNIVVHHGCTSPQYGPVTLVNPALTITNVLTTNPTTCNECNGTLKLFGLPPGEVDTVRYTYDLVPQPYILFPVNLDGEITLVNLCAGSYANIIVYTDSGCVSNTLGPFVLTNPTQQASFSDSIRHSCSGSDTVYFTNTSTPATNSARWKFGDGSIDTTHNPVHVYDTGGIYTVTLYTSNLFCVDSISHTVDTRHPHHASFTVTPDTICQGNMVSFINNSIGGNPTYLWSLGDGSKDPTTAIPDPHYYLNAGIYHVKLTETDSLSCVDTATVLVYVDSNAAVGFSVTDTSICAGKEITFRGNYTSIGLTGITWNFGDGTTAVINPVTHAYDNIADVKVTLSATYRKCPDTAYSRVLHIKPYPVIYLGRDTSICAGGAPISLGDSINLFNPKATWMWNTGATTAGITVAQPGLYYNTVTIAGCSNTDSVWVKNDCYLNIPNAFMPGSGDVNGYFLPRQLLSSGITSFKMELYNRWGQEIFSTESTTGRGWDGKYNNVLQPEGVYIYMIDASFKDGRSQHYQGNVTLLR